MEQMRIWRVLRVQKKFVQRFHLFFNISEELGYPLQGTITNITLLHPKAIIITMEID